LLKLLSALPFLLRAIGLSFFATGMGAWVVYGSTEMGANPNLSWLGEFILLMTILIFGFSCDHLLDFLK
jgi:hypothetical protein